MALGARSSHVVTMILWHGAAVALVGIVIGEVGGLALRRRSEGSHLRRQCERPFYVDQRATGFGRGGIATANSGLARG